MHLILIGFFLAWRRDTRLHALHSEIPSAHPTGHHPLVTDVRSRQTRTKGLVLMLTLLTLIVGCQSRKDKNVPDALVGVWKTSTAKYADRFFEITKDVIIFGTGDGNSNLHLIDNIDTLREDQTILYTITYLNPEGQPYNFSFYYDPAHDGVIRFKNQKQIAWTKGSVNR